MWEEDLNRRTIRKVLPLVLIFLLSYISPLTSSYGAFEEKGAGARPMGMGGAFTGVADDVNAIYCNPAGLKLVRGVEVMTMATQIFGLKDLTYYLFGGVVPTRKIGAFGTSYSQFGCAEYRESEIIISYGQSFGTGIYFGLNAKVMSLRIKGASKTSEYGGASAFGLDLGLLADISSRISLGVMAVNLNGPHLGKCSENLAQRVKVGTSFRFISGYIASLDIDLPISSIIVEPVIKAGLELALSRNLAIRAGVENEPARFTGGIGFHWSVFAFDYAFLSHPFLNGQHQFSLSLHSGGITKQINRPQ